LIRGYRIEEKTLEMKQDALDASACRCVLTHTLVDQEKQQQNQPTTAGIGCSQIQVVRNYVGDDDTAGDLLAMSISLSGTIQIWSLPEDMDNQQPDRSETTESPTVVGSCQKFKFENATGTCLMICPPNVTGVGDVLIAVPCLDGRIAVLNTGIVTPKTPDKHVAAEPGTVVDWWSKGGSSIALSGCWHPSKRSVAVGRQDGLVEILGERPHRLIHHETPVRAVSYTPDGNILITASDDGMICLWDTSRAVPVLANHVMDAHRSWILCLTTLLDSRRFVSSGADGTVRVWTIGQMDQPLHTFQNDNETAWTIHSQAGDRKNHLQQSSQTPPRLVSGSDTGRLHIYSLEG
jgi:WD40 repeat protein